MFANEYNQYAEIVGPLREKSRTVACEILLEGRKARGFRVHFTPYSPDSSALPGPRKQGECYRFQPSRETPGLNMNIAGDDQVKVEARLSGLGKSWVTDWQARDDDMRGKVGCRRLARLLVGLCRAHSHLG